MTTSDEERRLRDALASEAGQYVTVRRDDLAWAVGETWVHGEIERLREVVRAARAINWDDATEYEGRIDASLYLSVDALHAMRESLRSFP